MKHRPNIFREVKDLRANVQSRTKDNVYSSVQEVENNRLEAIDEILGYLKKLPWISHEHTKERMEYYLKKADLNAKKTAAAFDVKVNAIEVSVKYVSDKIRSLIGVPLSVIEQSHDVSTIESALADFRKATDSGVPVYRYFLSGIEPYLPNPQYNPKFNLADCKREIGYVALFAHYAEHILTKGCNQDRLAHVLSLVSSLNGAKTDHEALKKFFSGEFSQSETEESLEIGKQIDQMQEWLKNQNPYND